MRDYKIRNVKQRLNIWKSFVFVIFPFSQKGGDLQEFSIVAWKYKKTCLAFTSGLPRCKAAVASQWTVWATDLVLNPARSVQFPYWDHILGYSWECISYFLVESLFLTFLNTKYFTFNDRTRNIIFTDGKNWFTD